MNVCPFDPKKVLSRATLSYDDDQDSLLPTLCDKGKAREAKSQAVLKQQIEEDSANDKSMRMIEHEACCEVCKASIDNYQMLTIFRKVEGVAVP